MDLYDSYFSLVLSQTLPLEKYTCMERHNQGVTVGAAQSIEIPARTILEICGLRIYGWHWKLF